MSISLPNSTAWGPQLAPGGHHIEGPQGIPLYVEAHGSPAAPTKIMLVHGGLQCSLSYRRQIAPLTERDCYVILFDLPWHGLSGPGMEQPAPRPTAEILGQSVAAVRAHFGLQEEPLTLLGWSYGGIVLRSYLLQMRPSNSLEFVVVSHGLLLSCWVIALPPPERGRPGRVVAPARIWGTLLPLEAMRLAYKRV